MFLLQLLLICFCTFGVHGDAQDAFLDEITGEMPSTDDEQLNTEGFMEAIIFGLIDAQFTKFDENGDGGIDNEEFNSFKNLIPSEYPILHQLQIINYDTDRDLKLNAEELKIMIKNHLDDFMEALQSYFHQTTNSHEDL